MRFEHIIRALLQRTWIDAVLLVYTNFINPISVVFGQVPVLPLILFGSDVVLPRLNSVLLAFVLKFDGVEIAINVVEVTNLVHVWLFLHLPIG